MKTTVDIADELFIEAKRKAAELQRPLKYLFESALRRELQRLDSTRAGKTKTNWITVEGGLPPGLAAADQELESDAEVP